MNDLRTRDLQSSELRRRVSRAQGKRRYRAHAVLALLLVLGITILTVHSKNAGSGKSSSFTTDLDSISPFAKKKVLPPQPPSILMPLVREYLRPLRSVRIRSQTLQGGGSRNAPLSQILFLHTWPRSSDRFHPHGTFIPKIAYVDVRSYG